MNFVGIFLPILWIWCFCSTCLTGPAGSGIRCTAGDGNATDRCTDVVRQVQCLPKPEDSQHQHVRFSWKIRTYGFSCRSSGTIMNYCTHTRISIASYTGYTVIHLNLYRLIIIASSIMLRSLGSFQILCCSVGQRWLRITRQRRFLSNFPTTS